MKWTTANVKHPDYTQSHEIYVGTHIGSLKKIVPSCEKNPFKQSNLQDISQLEKDWDVSSLSFGNAEQTEILIGRGHKTVQLLSSTNDQILHTVDMQGAPVVGLARCNEQLIAGFGSGQIECALLEDEDATERHMFSAGDHISRLRQCPVQPALVATGGKGRQNNLKVFDLASGASKPIYTSKNVPPDFLQLEVPVWDSDVGFMDSPHMLATCSRTGYVRVYDTKAQRRPVQCYTNDQPQFSFSTLIARGNYIYTGTTMGVLKAFDIRQMKNFVHTYKGFTGGISDLCLDSSGKYLGSACLDRYVRLHHVDSCVQLYQCYVKSKAMRILIREGDPIESEEDVAETGVEKKGKKQQNKTKGELSDDEEYEEMFQNMQTINEKDEIAEEEAEAEDEPEESEEEEPQATEKSDTSKDKKNNAGAKRKLNAKTVKNKKKKN